MAPRKSSVDMFGIETEWLRLFNDLLACPHIVRDRIAAPFLSVPPANYDPVAVPSILYVGKATAGPWGLELFAVRQL